MPTFFQAGIIPGMLQGVHEGNMTFDTLAQHGNIGLGVLNDFAGDMIALDGEFYRIDAEGVVNLIEPNTCTPFSIVTKFKPTQIFSIENVNNIADLSELLDAELGTKNIFYFIRIDAEFEWLRLRSQYCRVLVDAVPDLQKNYELSNVQGSLVATRCPDYSAGFTIAGYHSHFIDQERTIGGHVCDLKIKKAKVMITPMRRFSVVLMNTKQFDQVNLEAQSALDLEKSVS